MKNSESIIFTSFKSSVNLITGPDPAYSNAQKWQCEYIWKEFAVPTFARKERPVSWV
jgi:hypothetical protein